MPSPPGFDREAVELYRTGLTMLQVAQKLAVSEQTVLRALRREGEPSRQRGRRTHNPEQVLDVFRRLGDVRATAEACAVRPGYIYKTLKANGMRARRTATIDRRKVVEMYLSGLNSVKIGNAFGVSDSAIRKLLVDEGVTLRPPGRRRAEPPSDLDPVVGCL